MWQNNAKNEWQNFFDGKLKRKYVGATLLNVLLAVNVFVVLVISFICIAVLHENVETDARIALYAVVGICVARWQLF